MQINKGDIILLFILIATFIIFGVTEYNIVHGYEQFSDSAWTAFMAIFGGELLTFALYRIGTAKYRPKEPSQLIEDIAENEGEDIKQESYQSDPDGSNRLEEDYE